jgi:hypothetical protein
MDYELFSTFAPFYFKSLNTQKKQMKKIIFAAFVMAACFASCEAPIVGPTEETTEQQSIKTKRFTFTLKGDFSDQWRPITRGYLSADGKDLTDVWVLDYKD